MSQRAGLRIALFIALATAIGVAYFQRGWLDAAAVQDWVRGAGWLGPMVFVAAYAIATVLFVPGSIITLAGGALFGPLWGATALFMAPGAFAYTWLGYVGREAAGGGEGLVRKALIATALMATLTSCRASSGGFVPDVWRRPFRR